VLFLGLYISLVCYKKYYFKLLFPKYNIENEKIKSLISLVFIALCQKNHLLLFPESTLISVVLLNREKLSLQNQLNYLK
jgi:hypothetical protein